MHLLRRYLLSLGRICCSLRLNDLTSIIVLEKRNLTETTHKLLAHSVQMLLPNHFVLLEFNLSLGHK